MWSEVEGKTKPSMQTVGTHTRSLVASQARPTLPPVMSRGPDYGVNYSYPVGWERWGDREEGLKPHRILQLCHSLQWFFFVVAVLPPFTQLNLGPSLVWIECNFKRHIWLATHSSGHPAAVALATQSFSAFTITVLKGHTTAVSMYCHYAYSRPCRVSYQRELLNVGSLSVKYCSCLFELHMDCVTKLAL